LPGAPAPRRRGDQKIAATGGLNLIGTQVSIGTAGTGSAQLVAGSAINIAAVTDEINTSVQNDPRGKQYEKQVQQIPTVVGADVAAAGNLTVSAGTLEKGGWRIGRERGPDGPAHVQRGVAVKGQSGAGAGGGCRGAGGEGCRCRFRQERLNVNVSLTVRPSESKDTETTSSLLNSGSVVNVGNDITLRASGAGRDSNISVIGSDLNAQGNITLKADN
jgi:hypothetical protein